MTTRKLKSTRSGEDKDLCKRLSDQPFISPTEIRPSDPRLMVVGVLNPTIFQTDGNRYLIVRVDETPRVSGEQDWFGAGRSRSLIPYVDVEDGSQLKILDVNTWRSTFASQRSVLGGLDYRSGAQPSRPGFVLSQISHLRIAVLTDDRAVLCNEPLIFPSNHFDQYGCEDPRATTLAGQPVVVYSCIGRFGTTSWFSRLHETSLVGEKSMLLGPDHKHSALFPEKIHNAYFMLSRPLARSYIRAIGIWLFQSPDLTHWGMPSPILFPRPGMWDSERVGPCASPIQTAHGWLFFYYGVDTDLSYQVGAALLDSDDPRRVIARSEIPVLSPVLKWERSGRRADTVFVCGAELLDGHRMIRLYYGAADTYVGLAEITMDDLLSVLKPRD